MIINEILRSLLPLIVLNGFVILLLVVFSFIYPRRAKDPIVLERMHKSFLGVFLREFWYWVTLPFISIFRILKLTPNMITGISLVFALISGYYYYRGNFAFAGWILIISGTLDILDGRLARTTGQVSQEGAFFDSCVDRYCDGLVFMGLALYFRNDFLVLSTSIMALIGSEVVSYARAKGESVGIESYRGLMQRGERIFLLSSISVLHPFFMVVLSEYGIKAEYPMIIVIIILAFSTNYTAVDRIVTTFKKIRNLDKRDG
ncbi:MAG: CDP-alcohol phosphatidyltransferase family protein [Spirochaetota bacterium]|nr:CDP-alcohol phosphatidyltransferase family protein [Spirochaetota bacterium]